MSAPSVDFTVTTTTEACALSRTWRHISLSWVVMAGLSAPAKSLTQSVGLSEETGSADASEASRSAASTLAAKCTRRRMAEDCTGSKTRNSVRWLIVQSVSSKSDAAEEFDDLLLGPVAVVAVGRGQERAMAAVRCLDESEIGIGGDLPTGFRNEMDERIVGGVQDEPGNRDAIHGIGGGGARVVVHGALKAAVVGGDLVVEVAQAPQAAQAAGVEVL